MITLVTINGHDIKQHIKTVYAS